MMSGILRFVTTSMLLLFFLVAAANISVLSRPLEAESAISPVSLPYITEHIAYWFRHVGWRVTPQLEEPTAGGVGDADGDVETGQSPFGLGGYGGLGGWGWGENEITVVVRIHQVPNRRFASGAHRSHIFIGPRPTNQIYMPIGCFWTKNHTRTRVIGLRCAPVIIHLYLQ